MAMMVAMTLFMAIMIVVTSDDNDYNNVYDAMMAMMEWQCR